MTNWSKKYLYNQQKIGLYNLEKPANLCKDIQIFSFLIL